MNTLISALRSPRRWIRQRKFRREGLAVVSFPKSGRTWLRFMLDQLGLPLLFKHEKSGLGASIEYTRDNIRFSPHRRVVFLHRNPLDTLVSYFHHASNVQHRFSGDISEFIRHPTFGIRYLLQFNREWLNGAPHFEAFLAITYEQLREDPRAQLRRVADFCNADYVSDRSILRAVEAGRFDRMRKLERSGWLAEAYPGRFSKGDGGAESRKVRAGKVGGYRDFLNRDDVDYCIEQARDVGWPIEDLLARDDPQLRELTGRG